MASMKDVFSKAAHEFSIIFHVWGSEIVHISDAHGVVLGPKWKGGRESVWITRCNRAILHHNVFSVKRSDHYTKCGRCGMQADFEVVEAIRIKYDEIMAQTLRLEKAERRAENAWSNLFRKLGESIVEGLHEGIVNGDICLFHTETWKTIVKTERTIEAFRDG